MNKKVENLLGMARKAGKICSGEAQIEALLKKRKGFLLIMAVDAPHTIKKYGKWCQDLQIPTRIEGEKLELGSAIGMSPRAAILIMDKGFAEAIEKAGS